MLRDPHTLEVKSGGGVLVYVGLVLFGLGLLCLIVGNPGVLSRLLMYLLIMLVGLVIMLIRWGIVIDRAEGKTVKWWGFLKPLVRSTLPLTTFTMVTLERERFDGEGPLVYVVRMESDTGPEKLVLSIVEDAEEGRAEAEKLTQFLGKPSVFVEQDRGAGIVGNRDGARKCEGRDNGFYP